MEQKKMSLAISVAGIILLSSLTYAEAKSESRTLWVHVNVEPVFLVEVTPHTRGNTIEFGAVQHLFGQVTQTEPVQVDISVISNLGVPYQVSQSMSGLLSNEEGVPLPQESFLVEASQASLGIGKITNLKSVSPEGEILFESNAKGNSDQFTASYLLKIPPTQAGGNYQTNLVYTIATKE